VSCDPHGARERPAPPLRTPPNRPNPSPITWPLQDIPLLIMGLCTSQYSFWHSTPPLLHPPPLYFAINIAQYIASPRPPCVAIQYIIFAMAISCKGQAHRLPLLLRVRSLAHLSSCCTVPFESGHLRPGGARVYCSDGPVLLLHWWQVGRAAGLEWALAAYRLPCVEHTARDV